MRRAEIEQRATRLLKQHKVTGPPVPVRRIAEREGLRVLTEPFEGEDISGMLYRKSDVSIILVNSSDILQRQRFTVGHELGHYLLHEGDTYVDKRARINFRDSRSGLALIPEEIDANQFAAALLMPQDWVLGEANRWLQVNPSSSDEEIIGALARIFNVSRMAMEIRLADFGVLGPL